MELVITDVDEAARTRELAALERCCHALVGGASQQDEDDRGAAEAQRPTHGRH